MRTLVSRICLVALGLLVVGGILSGEDGQVIPSRYYLQDDVQYFPTGLDLTPATEREGSAVLGDLLFTNVVSVHYVGPGHPANPDGSLGGLVVGDFEDMKIYERYIVREATNSLGETYRESHAYTTLGKIEQRFTSSKVKVQRDAY